MLTHHNSGVEGSISSPVCGLKCEW